MKATIRKVAGRWQWECREDGNHFVVYGSCKKWEDALKVALDQLRNHYRWNSWEELHQWKDRLSV